VTGSSPVETFTLGCPRAIDDNGVAHRIGVLGVLLVCVVTAARAQGLPATDIHAVDAFHCGMD
jgi:hypothetical protein